MKNLLLIFAVLFSLCSCSETEFSENMQQSKITAVVYDVEPTVPELFMDEIAWFNPRTREIKFKTVEGGSHHTFPGYRYIGIKLEDELLFTIVGLITPATSRAYDDLVLYNDFGTSKFYLYDSWPEYWSPKTTEINRQKREKNWNRFLEQLKKEHRLRY